LHVIANDGSGVKIWKKNDWGWSKH
jgi:hypothetical protein